MPFEITPIARIQSPFTGKFAIPRQSNIAGSVQSRIVFEPEFSSAESLRGIDGFEYLWLIWQFSLNRDKGWTPTVRPPRLGGNRRVGVFASRSPFRPNSLALSSVRLEKVEWESGEGPVLFVSGADLLDGSPIFDIKPYLPYTDAHPAARSGFAPEADSHSLAVECPQPLLEKMPEELRQPLLDILSHDPRPQYHSAPQRKYGFNFGGHEIAFQVNDNQVLKIISII